MALEDLTGTAKFITALNAAWPVDDDWVDEGDNHIRGIKNVLKNTFPDTNVAVSWSSTQARFPSGTQAAPGMAWSSEVNSGFYRSGAGTFGWVVAGTPVWTWTGATVYLPPAITLTAQGPVNLGTTGVEPRLTVKGGFAGTLADMMNAPLRLDASVNSRPGMIWQSQAGPVWLTCLDATSRFTIGSNAATGPGGLNGNALLVDASGQIYARAFNQAVFAARNIAPLTGALNSLLSVRGRRCFNEETQRNDFMLEAAEVGEAFPEVASEVTPGEPLTRSINYAALAAPMIEAIRELEARVRELEAKLAAD